jgi:hypothetical protein
MNAQHWVDVLMSSNRDLDAYQAGKRRALFADMIACFTAYNIRIAGELRRGALLVENATGLAGDLFSIGDNGGEVNVARINSHVPSRDAPYTRYGVMIDGATLAYRIRRILDDAAIDYELDVSNMLETLKGMSGS